MDKFQALGRRLRKDGKTTLEDESKKVFGVAFDRTSEAVPVVIKAIVEYFGVKGGILSDTLNVLLTLYVI
jgi:hypothetical protein